MAENRDQEEIPPDAQGEGLEPTLTAIVAMLRRMETGLNQRLTVVEQNLGRGAPPAAPQAAVQALAPRLEEMGVEPRRVLRPRDEDANHLKIKAPTFAGKVDPEAYLEWEERMDHIFACYNYSETKMVTYAAAQLTENALTWWNREVAERRRYRHHPISTWIDMKFELKKRYVPPHYFREVQRRFRRLTQGTRSVEEYYEEFEHLRTRAEIDDTPENIMSQFLDGLQDRISRKVERQVYNDIRDLVHLATQVEMQNKKKAATTRSKPQVQSHWTPSTSRPMDRGKAIEVDSRFKTKPAESTKTTTPNTNVTTRAREIVCFKCQGRGHMARECPNQKVMILIDGGGYESQDEEAETETEEEEEFP